MFVISLELSEWYTGLESLIEDNYDNNITPTDMFEEYFCNSFILKKPIDDMYFGVFSDRKSALKFKKWFLGIIDDEVKDKISDVFSILNADTEYLNKTLESFNEIRINALYHDRDVSISNWGFDHPIN